MKEQQGNKFGLYISIINRAAQGYFYNKLKNFDIGPGQQAYLLSISPGETIVQDMLAKRLQVDKANVTRALKGLEKSGYINRVRSASDKRAWEVSLTKSGEDLRIKLEEISINWVEKLKAPLTDNEWNQIEDSLEKIVKSF